MTAKSLKKTGGKANKIHKAGKSKKKKGGKKTTMRRGVKRRSPVSRFALFLGALVLPFRRRLRVKSLDDDASR